MRQRRSLVLATLVSPLSVLPAAVFVGLATAAVGGGSLPQSMAVGVFAGGFLSTLGVLIAYGVVLLYLLPVCLLLRRLGKATLWTVAAAGLLGGGALGLPERSLFSVGFFGYFGVVVAVVFWFLGRPALARPVAGGSA